MKTKILLFLLVCGLVIGLGNVPNVHAYPTISSYWDVGTDWGGDTDGDSLTQSFNAIQYFANTSSYQYDDNGTPGLNVGDTFRDYGNSYATALLPASPPIDTEGLNSTYEFTFAWTDLIGYVSEINIGATTDTITTKYTGGTIDFYLDTPPGSGTSWASHGATVSATDGSDTGFIDGTLVATINITSGTGHNSFDAGTTNFTGGDYNLLGEFTFLTPGFWYEDTGEDLLTKYVNIGWLLGYTAGDTDSENFYQTFGGTDPDGDAVLYSVHSDHDSSFTLQVVPEPATMLLLGSGLLGLAGIGRKKKFFKKD